MLVIAISRQKEPRRESLRHHQGHIDPARRLPAFQVLPRDRSVIPAVKLLKGNCIGWPRATQCSGPSVLERLYLPRVPAGIAQHQQARNRRPGTSLCAYVHLSTFRLFADHQVSACFPWSTGGRHGEHFLAAAENDWLARANRRANRDWRAHPPQDQPRSVAVRTVHDALGMKAFHERAARELPGMLSAHGTFSKLSVCSSILLRPSASRQAVHS
jgi:hypothetical protein